MQALRFRQAMERIRHQLMVSARTTPNGNILLGVAGYVASGKSWLCKNLLPDIETLTRRSVNYLPFDLWINKATVQTSTDYGGRFLLDDFSEALRCIHSGERFLVPRYDIVKTAGIQKIEDQLAIQQIFWNGKSFVQCLNRFQMLSGSVGLYVETRSGYVYSLFPAITNSTFLIDGTLIFPDSIASLYNCKIFVQASWPLRIARMIRRFNRKEVFGTTSKTMNEYVGFLVKEARLCADSEIYQQIDADTFLIESIPNTISNYFDLVYLRWYMQQADSPQWVTIKETEFAMQTYIQSLRREHDAEIIESNRRELLALMESKHLLALPDADKHLLELATIIL